MCNLDRPIWFKYRQLNCGKYGPEELQIVFWTFNVRNIKELESKIKCEKLMFQKGISYGITVANADIRSLKCHL